MVKEKVAASVLRLDAWLIGFFARPWPRKVGEYALWSVTHVEQIFFMPFRLLIVPARLFLESRHAKHIRKHR